MEYKVQGSPDWVKDSKSKAVLLKKPKNQINIEIDNLKARVKNLEEQNSQIIANLKQITGILDKMIP